MAIDVELSLRQPLPRHLSNYKKSGAVKPSLNFHNVEGNNTTEKIAKIDL